MPTLYLTAHSDLVLVHYCVFSYNFAVYLSFRPLAQSYKHTHVHQRRSMKIKIMITLMKNNTWSISNVSEHYTQINMETA